MKYTTFQIPTWVVRWVIFPICILDIYRGIHYIINDLAYLFGK